MALFPSNPSNGDTANVNGITYTFYSNQTAWVRTGSFLGNVVADNGDFSGNITANFFIGNGSQLTGITATVANTVSNNAQPNITSVGTLTSLSVSGNANAGNVGATNFVGSGASLTNLNASNISSGTLAQARLANASVTLGSTALTLGSTVTTVAGLSSVTSTTFVGSLSGAATTAGTVTTAAQPNITSVGTLTSLTVSGNANAGNVGATNFVGSGASLTNLNASNLASGTVPSASLSGSYSISVTGSAGTAGTVTTAAQPNITSVGTLTGLGVNGTVTAVNFTANTGVFTGNGSGLSAIAGANVTGTVSSATTATTAGTVTTAAQPNITSTGTLTSLTVSGNVSVADRIIHTGDTDTAIRFPTADTFTVETAGSERLRVTSTGLVGIGTAGPGTLLDVSQSANASVIGRVVNANTGTSADARSLVTNGTTQGGLIMRGTGHASADQLVIFQGSNTQPMTFFTSGGERMRLTNTGNLGIGTTSPATKLDVNGDITVKSNIAYVSPNGANTINSTMLNGGTLAWSGNAGQLFSITDSMTGNIFTVNDVSGIPLISVDSGGNIQFAASGGFVNYGVTTGISAAGSTQGTATALTRPINVVSTVGEATRGVILPTVPAGARVIVMATNTNGLSLNVYPPSGAAINSGSTNAAYSMPAGTRLEFISVSATQWYTMNATYG